MWCILDFKGWRNRIFGVWIWGEFVIVVVILLGVLVVFLGGVIRCFMVFLLYCLYLFGCLFWDFEVGGCFLRLKYKMVCREFL